MHEPTFPISPQSKETGSEDDWWLLVAIVLRSIDESKTEIKLRQDSQTCIHQHPASLEPELNFCGVESDSGVGAENQSSIAQTNSTVMTLARWSRGWRTKRKRALQNVRLPKMRELQRNILNLQKKNVILLESGRWITFAARSTDPRSTIRTAASFTVTFE